MRFFWLAVLASVCLVYGQDGRGEAVLFASVDEKNVRIVTLKLQLALEENETLGRMFSRNGWQVVPQRYGEYYAVTIQPVDTASMRNRLRLLFGKEYGGMFFIREREQSNYTPPPQSAPPDWFGTIRMGPSDWLWLAILLLAFSGLTASILQRKNIFRFKEAQTQLSDEQNRIEEEMDILQGEKRG